MASDGWNHPLSKAEMEAMRRAAAAEFGLRRNERRIRSSFWPRFRAVAGRVPFAEDVLAAFFCATDRATPLRVRAALFAALVYFLWPMGAIPRLAVAVGLLDEAAVLLLTLRALGGAIKSEHRDEARRVLHGHATIL